MRKTTQELFNSHKAGEITRSKFLYEIRRDPNLSQFVTNLTSYDDAVKILKNRGLITEIIEKSDCLTLDTANPYEYSIGLDIELGMAHTPTPKVIDPDKFKKAQQTVLKNLGKDPNYYTKVRAGIKPDKEPLLNSNSQRGIETPTRLTHPVEIKGDKGNFKHPDLQMREVPSNRPKGNKKVTKSILDPKVQPNQAPSLPKEGNKKQPKGKIKQSKLPGSGPQFKQTDIIHTMKDWDTKMQKVSTKDYPLYEGIDNIGNSLFQEQRPKSINQNIALEETNVENEGFLDYIGNIHGGSGHVNKIHGKKNQEPVKKPDVKDKNKNELFGFGKKSEPSKPQGIDPSMAIQIASNYTSDSFSDISSQQWNQTRDLLRAIEDRIPGKWRNQFQRAFEKAYSVQENIPAATTEMLPFANVEPGMQAKDDSGETFKIVAKGDYNQLKRYDHSGSMNKFLSSDPTGIDGNQLVALIDAEGNTFVRVYGTGGVYVYNNQTMERQQLKEKLKELFRKEFNEDMDSYTNDDLKNKKKAYLQARIKADQDEMNDLHEELGSVNGPTGNKVVPQDETEMAEAKAAVLPTITKAGLHQNNFNLDRDVVLKDGYIWVKIIIGQQALTKDQLKALTSDGKFAGLNPVSDSEVTLIFNRGK